MLNLFQHLVLLILERNPPIRQRSRSIPPRRLADGGKSEVVIATIAMNKSNRSPSAECNRATVPWDESAKIQYVTNECECSVAILLLYSVIPATIANNDFEQVRSQTTQAYCNEANVSGT